MRILQKQRKAENWILRTPVKIKTISHQNEKTYFNNSISTKIDNRRLCSDMSFYQLTNNKH